MNSRKAFLLALFRILEEKKVPYAVVRNYDDIYSSTASDVDVAVEPEELDRFKQSLSEAAAATGYVEILRARYVNFSYVYLHPEGGFLRIDAETETRWRVFPVLSAKAVVGLRRRHAEFYIPHPRHESIILFVASIWRGAVSERYRLQLASLYTQLSDLEFRRTFRGIFGTAGDMLADYQMRIAMDPSATFNLKVAKRALIAQAFRKQPNRRALIHNLTLDTHRFIDRVRRPPGISLVFASSAKPAWKIDKLLDRMEFLYPAKKIRRNKSPAEPDTPSWRLWFERFFALFKGGLFLSFHALRNDSEIPEILGTHSRLLYSSRAFVCIENSRGEMTLAHMKTGFMAQLDSTQKTVSREDDIIRFITGILNRSLAREESHFNSAEVQRKGVFAVLLGLDGSGKTTVARELCCQVGEMGLFQAVRYYHWRPALGRQATFPIASGTNVPRKTALDPNPMRSAVSVLRLFKNLLLTQLAWWLRVRKLLRQRTLVLMDRYFYNYYLDPVSVRYYGPAWLLDQAHPAFPQPDMIIVLRAPAATLLARKQELSEEEIHRQSAVLEQLALRAPRSIVVDGTRPAAEVAREILSKIAALDGRKNHQMPLAVSSKR